MDPADPIAGDNAPAPQPAAPKAKKRLMVVLAGLYAASLLAACVLLRGASKTESAARLLDLSSQASESVGWVAIHGAIFNSASGRPWEQGSEQWARRIKEMAETKGVKAIVLDINSPGGSVGAVQELHSQIERVRREKKIPIVALFDDVAASGGYYIASACDRIVAHPGTLTGSIGVIFEVTNAQGLLSKIGVKMDPVKSGPHKDIGSPARAMTPEERKLMQALIDDAYGQFVAAVAAGRHLPVETVRRLADGRVFSGDQALAAGLVDELGDSTDAVELAGRLAGIKGRPEVRRNADHFGELFDMLQSRFSGGLAGLASGLSESFTPHSGLLYLWRGW